MHSYSSRRPTKGTRDVGPIGPLVACLRCSSSAPDPIQHHQRPTHMHADRLAQALLDHRPHPRALQEDVFPTPSLLIRSSAAFVPLRSSAPGDAQRLARATERRSVKRLREGNGVVRLGAEEGEDVGCLAVVRVQEGRRARQAVAECESMAQRRDTAERTSSRVGSAAHPGPR